MCANLSNSSFNSRIMCTMIFQFWMELSNIIFNHCQSLPSPLLSSPHSPPLPLPLTSPSPAPHLPFPCPSPNFIDPIPMIRQSIRVYMD